MNPNSPIDSIPCGQHIPGDCSCSVGLTNRDHFAGLAMHALISDREFRKTISNEDRAPVILAEIALRYADAMIKVLTEEEVSA